MTIANLFISLRLLSPAIPAPIEVIAFFMVWVALWLPIAIPIAFALKWRPNQPLGNKKLPFLASLYLIVPFVLWGVSWVERTSFSEWGLSWQPKTLLSTGLGFSLGVVSTTLLFAIQFAWGWIQWKKTTTDSSLTIADLTKKLYPSVLITLILGLWVSVTEELIFRGCLQNLLQQDYSWGVAAAIASLIFALAHLIWEFQETLPQLPGLWLMGMVLAWARICDNGSLGLAIGLHASWIWVIASLDTAELLDYTNRVPQWVTGIHAKPLAGVTGILLLLVTATILAFSRHPIG